MNNKESILEDLRRRASALQAYSDNNELYSIVGSLIQKDMTTLKCREYISAYEEEHMFYFALFKPQIEIPKQSWIENAKTCYLYTFESPLVFKMIKGSTSFEINFEEECQCCRKTPEIIGQFPIANNTIDLDRIRSLGE